MSGTVMRNTEVIEPSSSTIQATSTVSTQMIGAVMCSRVEHTDSHRCYEEHGSGRPSTRAALEGMKRAMREAGYFD